MAVKNIGVREYNKEQNALVYRPRTTSDYSRRSQIKQKYFFTSFLAAPMSSSYVAGLQRTRSEPDIIDTIDVRELRARTPKGPGRLRAALQLQALKAHNQQYNVRERQGGSRCSRRRHKASLLMFQQYSTQQSPNGSSWVIHCPPGVFSPPGPQPLNELSASPSAAGPDNPTLATTVLNEYDKAVELDQRKL